MYGRMQYTNRENTIKKTRYTKNTKYTKIVKYTNIQNIQ